MPPVREHLLDCSPLSPANSNSEKKKNKTQQPRTDPTTWRESQIPPDEMITSSQAWKWYRIKRLAVLNEIEWEPYQCLDPKAKKQVVYTTFIASHREIERKAWQRHGGPEGWDTHQNHRRELWNSRWQGSKPFPEPITHGKLSPSLESNARLQLDVEIPPANASSDTPSLINDPYVTNANLRGLYRQFISRFYSPWVWEKCHTALNAAGVFDNAARKSHLETALITLPRYPMKQHSRIPRNHLGQSVIDVLRRAPQKAGSHGMEAVVHPHGGILYVWSVAYLTDLYKSLNTVIDKQGIASWRKLRWRVYQTYEQFQGGIYFNNHDGTWGDPAFKWLAGKAEPGSFIYSERSKCQRGIEYNERLPVDKV